jgi:hypothetical protein
VHATKSPDYIKAQQQKNYSATQMQQWACRDAGIYNKLYPEERFQNEVPWKAVLADPNICTSIVPNFKPP